MTLLWWRSWRVVSLPLQAWLLQYIEQYGNNVSNIKPGYGRFKVMHTQVNVNLTLGFMWVVIRCLRCD